MGKWSPKEEKQQVAIRKPEGDWESQEEVMGYSEKTEIFQLNQPEFKP